MRIMDEMVGLVDEIISTLLQIFYLIKKIKRAPLGNNFLLDALFL
jgi:hypothetical protein